MISDAVILSIIASGVGVIGLLIKYSFASKCNRTNCCFGCIQIERDTIHEQNIVNDDIKIDVQMSPVGKSSNIKR